MSGLSTHILDVSRGLPASGVAIRLEWRQSAALGGEELDDQTQAVPTVPILAFDWHPLAQATSDLDGRAQLIAADGDLKPGDYRLSFEVEPYFRGQGVAAFYPLVQVIFRVETARRLHVPLLLSPFGFSTYRGS